MYPYHQPVIRGAWLAQVLGGASSATAGPSPTALRDRGLELRCEPGRALLDGCGLTAARVGSASDGGTARG